MMLRQNLRAYEFRAAAGRAAVPALPPMAGYVRAGQRQRSEAAIDDALSESFPASDPPAWNTGVARLGGAVEPGASLHHDRVTADASTSAGARSGVLDVSRTRDSQRTLGEALRSLAAAAGLAMLAPFAILLVGLPVALAGRGLLELLQLLGAIG
jgi:hypothetical protein